MQIVEQLGGRVAGATKPIGDFAMSEMGVDFARVRGAALGHKSQDGLRLPLSDGAPRGRQRPRMHERLHTARQEAIVDEKVFLDVQPVVATLQVTRTVAPHTMAQRQVLGAGRGSDRVGLHEAHPHQRLGQCGRFEQTARNRIAAQLR